MKLETAIKKAQVLIEALPYLKKFHKKIFVIKYGGSILGEERVRKEVLEDIVFLAFSGIRPVLVHGGGPQISERLKKEGIKTEFYEGMRKTDLRTLEIVEEELNKINDLLVKEISSHKANVRGFKTEDCVFIAEKKVSEIDLGYVGRVIEVNPEKILKACREHFIPVITPMGISKTREKFNLNADESASKLAAKLKAEKLIFLTDVRGIMRGEGENNLIPTLTESEAQELIREGIINKGMLPKVQNAISALKEGVKKVHIISALIPHSLLLEIFTDEGIGTEILR